VWKQHYIAQLDMDTTMSSGACWRMGRTSTRMKGRHLVVLTLHSALQLTVKMGHETTVRLMLEKGADVNAQRGDFGNALQTAANKGNEGILRLLLEKGAHVNAQGGNYGSALQAAAYNGNEGIMRLLMEKGADINSQRGY
jgi:ankyrin repeat protein